MTQEKLMVANGLAKKIKELKSFIEGVQRGENIALQAGISVPYMVEIESNLPFERTMHTEISKFARALLKTLENELNNL